MVSIESFREWAVIDGDVNDTSVELALMAAKNYFANAGVPEPEEDNPLYDLGVYRLATHYVDNRGPVTSGTGADNIPYGITGIILQLRSERKSTEGE